MHALKVLHEEQQRVSSSALSATHLPWLPAALAWLAPAQQVWHAVCHAGHRHLAHPGHVRPLALQRCGNSARQPRHVRQPTDGGRFN